MNGRKPSAAMPVAGYQCLDCPGQPFVPTGGSRFDPIAAQHAFDEFATHRKADHPQGNDLLRGVRVIGKLGLGPAGTAAIAALGAATEAKAA